MSKVTVITFLFFFTSLALADDCGFLDLPKKDLRFTRFPPREGSACIVSAAPRSGVKGEPIVFNSQGQIMIALNLGNTGKVSKDSGSHTYFLLPAKENPSLGDRAEQSPAIIKTASGNEFELGANDNKKLSILNIDGCQKRDSARAWLSEQGELNVKSCKGRIFIDAKAARGKQAIEDRNGKSTLIAENGQSCEVSNQELYNYKSGVAKGDVKISLKHQSEQQLQSLLKSQPQCKGLSLSTNSDAGNSTPASKSPGVN